MVRMNYVMAKKKGAGLIRRKNRNKTNWTGGWLRTGVLYCALLPSRRRRWHCLLLA